MRYFILILMSVCLFGADEPKSPSTLIYEKALSENARDASVAFESYWKALEVANAKVIKALESAKADLNDSRKGSLSISDRAKAIMELDEKITAIKNGAINEILVENKKKTNVPNVSGDSQISIVGKWARIDNNETYECLKDGSGKLGGSPFVWVVKDKEANIYDINFSNASFNRKIQVIVAKKEAVITFNDGSTRKLTYSK